MSSEHYPLPAHAAYIWAVGDQLFIGFPPTVGEKGHTVTVKADANGLTWALTLLKERERQGRDSLRIGKRSTEPTQYQLDAIIKAMKAGAAAKKIDGSAMSLEDLGL